MVLFKEKKSRNRTLQSDLRITLDAQHTNKIKTFYDNKKFINKKYKKLSLLQNELNLYKARSSNTLTDSEIEHKMTIIEEIQTIQKEINNIENYTDVNKYLVNTCTMLFQYYDDDKNNQNQKKTTKKKNEILNINNKSVVEFFCDNKYDKNSDYNPIDNSNDNYDCINNNDNNNDNSNDNSNDDNNDNKNEQNYKDMKLYSKMEIIDKYFNYTNDKYINDNNQETLDLDYCSSCLCERIFYQSEGIMICPSCATQEKILIDSDKPSYKEPPREISYFAYKRINHFNEWLAQFQAKESTDISKEIYNSIKQELLKESYVDMKNLKISKIRDVLKKLNLNKYYEHVPHIINRLSGKPAPIIDRDIEEKLRMMFKEIQNPWINHCPNKRSNFLSYSYVLYKCLQLLEMDDFLKHFSLLKSREKLAEQDKIWKKICDELKWQYIKTI